MNAMRGTLATLARSRSAGAFDAPTATKSRIAVVGIVGCLLGAIAYVNVYVPVYSPEARRARERTAAHGGAAHASAPAAATAAVPVAPPGTVGGDAPPGSMWRSITAQREWKAGDRPPASA